MNKTTLEKQKIVVQIEEAAKKYADIKKNTENEISKIKNLLLNIGVPGSTIVKLQPIWQHDVNYLLKKETENLDTEISKKAG
ncbi:hypothetical protein KJ966_08030 [bacterium]|nr:hypothetical protein [bacterium]